MKKIIALILAVVMVIGLTACGKAPEKPSDEKPGNDTGNTPAPSASSGNLVPVDPRIEFIGAAPWVSLLYEEGQGQNNPTVYDFSSGDQKLIIVDNTLLVQVHANDGSYETAMSFEISEEYGTIILYCNQDSSNGGSDYKHENAYVREDKRDAALLEYKNSAAKN